MTIEIKKEVVYSAAFGKLSNSARVAYVLMLSQRTGRGESVRLPFSVANNFMTSHTFINALKQLEREGFIKKTQKGGLYRKINTYVFLEDWKKQGSANLEFTKSRAAKYQEYIHGDVWKKKSNKKIKQAKGRCQLCNNDKLALHVHHRTYEHLGHENLSDLIVLCRDCHSKFHGKDFKPETIPS